MIVSIPLPISQEMLEGIETLYRQAGWRAYLNDPAKLVRALDGSLYLACAFHEKQLIGMVRVVGDGEHVVLIQDLLVEQSHRREGVGRALLAHVIERYQDVRTKLVLTDVEDPVANEFYRSMGLRPIADHDMIAYIV